MALRVNLRHLVDRDLVLQGELSAAELELDTRDELIRVAGPLVYDLGVQRLDESLLLRGDLRLKLDCDCVRCLKTFTHQLEIAGWICDVPLDGDESAPVVNDCVDLTPYLREDTLLAIPQHPLCKPECDGLKSAKHKKNAGTDRTEVKPSAWAELDKLKL